MSQVRIDTIAANRPLTGGWTLQAIAYGALVVSIACGRDVPQPQQDTAVAAVPSAPNTPRAGSSWMSELGAGVLVPSDSEGTAIVLFPQDASSLADVPVTLLTPDA